MSWDEAAPDIEAYEKWFFDGELWLNWLSLWDVWIPDVTMDDWESLYAFALGTYPSTFELGGTPAMVPATAAEVFAMKDSAGIAALRIDVGGVRIDCLFLMRKEIELTYYVPQPTFEERFNSIVAFMEAVGRLLRKRVELKADLEDRDERPASWTWEGRHENPDAVYSPQEDRVRWLGSGIKPP